MTTAMASSIMGGSGVSSLGMLANNAKAKETERSFAALVDGMRAGSDAKEESVKRPQDTRLPGDYVSSLALENPTAADRAAKPVGAAANAGEKGSIDKTSKLYEQALELESYFVKIMLSSMRNTISKTNLSGGSDYAQKMYDDMYYEELSRDVTKSAGFGLADEIYLELAAK